MARKHDSTDHLGQGEVMKVDVDAKSAWLHVLGRDQDGHWARFKVRVSRYRLSELFMEVENAAELDAQDRMF